MWWEFNSSINQWVLWGGDYPTICGNSCVANRSAVYGTVGIPAAGDSAGDRFGSAGWTDSSGNFWVFGGHADYTGHLFYNDLWKYQPGNCPLPVTATPTFNPAGGTYGSAQSVTMHAATDGALIYYTTDGTTPTINSTAYFPAFSPPISVQHSETITAIAVADGCLTSRVATAGYNLPPQAATPSFSVPTGTYTAFQTVTLSDATPGATIYYTLDGSAPTTSSNVYTGPLSVTTQLTVRAIATASGYSISNIGSATYALNLPTAAMPKFNVLDGTYNTPQSVTLSDTTLGATIYYQINGYPSAGSPVYTGPIVVSSPETIRAIATAPNYFQSGIAGATYDINLLAPQTSAPTFSVPAGTYTTPQTVTISDSTNLASIYYTLDGSTPTPTSSSYLYAGLISISSSEKLQAVAVAPGDTLSPVTSATYTINLPPAGFSIAGAAMSVRAGATTGNTSTITLTPSNGFTGVVSLNCAITPVAASDPATCSIAPLVTINGPAVQTVLTVKTTAASFALNPATRLLRPLMGGTAIAWVLLWGVPNRTRRRKNFLAMLVLLAAILQSTVGCGGSLTGQGGNAGGGDAGTSTGSYVITVTGNSGAITQTGMIALTVQ